MPPDRLPQTATAIAPAIIPARAPPVVSRRQYRLSSTTGPKVAPNPAQAKATRLRIVSLASHAMAAATTETSITAPRPIQMPTPRPVSLRKTLYRSSTSADDDTSSCDEIVDMIAARIAAIMNPAISGWKSSCPSAMNTVSGLSSCPLSRR